VKIEELNHPETPISLREINKKIAATLDSASDSRFSELQQLIIDRDVFITAYLENLDAQDKREFAIRELDVNNSLKDIVRKMLEDAKDEVTHFVRSKSAAEKYK